MPALLPSTPPKRRIGKIIGLSLFSILGTVLLLFLLLFFKNIWILRYGDTITQQKLVDQFSSNFTSDPRLAELRAATTFDGDITKYIRPMNPQTGDLKSPVTIVAFIDFQCPFTQQAYPTLEEIRKKYAPVARLVIKHFPLETIHPQAKKAAIASACVHKQGKFWNYYQSLFQNRDLDETTLQAYAVSTGIREENFLNCYAQEAPIKEIEQDMQDGIDLGVRGTPTYFINNIKVEGAISAQTWDELILKAINSK